jgi:CheY-like chemotaxis protein/HPt (histidine-containing phosphotransfer) domain-containing protein
MLINTLENKGDSGDTTTYLPQSKANKNIKILLVEDTPLNRKVILNQLKQIGYQADYVENGQEALDRLAEESYDLIFMDCQMPILDGYETTRLLREREGENAHTVVVAVTAYAMKGDREKCLAAGMDDYLTKPVRMAEIAQVLAKWMPEKSPEKKPDLIDRHRLAEISGGDKTFEIELIESYLQETQGYLTQLNAGLSNFDSGLVAQIASRVNGASANVGINKIAEIARRLQEIAKLHHLKPARDLIGELNSLLQQLNGYLTELKLINGTSVEISDNLATNALPQLELSLGDRSPRETGDDLTIEEIIDRDRLQKISLGEQKFIEQLLITFISNTEIYLEQATTAFANNDMETLARRTHQIKGSSSTVGVRFMPEIAAKVQKYAQQNQPQEIPQLLHQLKELLARVKHWQSNEFYF